MTDVNPIDFQNFFMQFAKSREEREIAHQADLFLYQLWERSGGFDDAADDALATSSSVITQLQSQTAQINSRIEDVESQIQTFRASLEALRGQINNLDIYIPPTDLTKINARLDELEGLV